MKFYVSEPQVSDANVPLVTYVQGTGCSSHFAKRNGRVLKGVRALVYDTFVRRARVVMVEKPSVVLFDDQDDRPMQDTCSSQFFYEHTLDRWAEAIAASVRSEYTLPGVNDASTLVLGISEGGMVGVRVSNILPDVTHVASLAGGGPDHMYVAAEYVRRRSLDPEELVYDCWREIQTAGTFFSPGVIRLIGADRVS